MGVSLRQSSRTYFNSQNVPLKGLETSCELEELRSLLLLHSIVEELTNSVHLLIAQVTVGTEVERRGGEFNKDAASYAS